MWHGERNTFCMIFWCKSCATIFVERDNEIGVFSDSSTKICVVRSPLGMFRVAIAYLSRLERPCIEPRIGMFRTSVRHVSQRRTTDLEPHNHRSCTNLLFINGLHNNAKKRVFPPNASVVAKNNVDFNIDCRQNSQSSYMGCAP